MSVTVQTVSSVSETQSQNTEPEPVAGKPSFDRKKPEARPALDKDPRADGQLIKGEGEMRHDGQRSTTDTYIIVSQWRWLEG